MKKIISTVLAILIVFSCSLTALVSCGKPEEKVAADFVMPEGGFDTSKPVEITFYHSMGKTLQEVLDYTIQDFNEKYPNVTVKHKSYGDYDGVLSQISTEITVGNQPNIAYCYADHVALYNVSQAVQTLDVFMNDETYGFSDAELADFIDGALDEGKSFGDDKTYLIPIAKSTEVLYYNKTFFDKHNLTVPTTWDEMYTLCKQIKNIIATENEGKAAKDRIVCTPLGYDSESNWFITMCEQYGSDYTSATDAENFRFYNDKNIEFVETFNSWYKEGLVTTQTLSGGYTSDLFKGAQSGAISYMCIGSTGGATYQQPKNNNGVYEFEVGIAPIPQVDVSNPKVISQGPSICIFKNDDPQEVLASWLFMKHLATDVNFQASVSMANGYAPVIKSIQQNEIYADFLASAEVNGTENIQAYAVKVALSQSPYYFVSDAFNGSSVARTQVGLLLAKCISYSGTDIKKFIEDAFTNAVGQCKKDSGQT